MSKEIRERLTALFLSRKMVAFFVTVGFAAFALGRALEAESPMALGIVSVCCGLVTGAFGIFGWANSRVHVARGAKRTDDDQ
jgi:hypothetical protein